jgi:hypothetical protein
MASRPSRSPGAPAPGAALGPAPLSLLHGDFAAVTLNNGGGAVTFNVFDWRVQYRTRNINTRAHGERWARRTPVESEWTFTGQGYITSASAAHAANAGFANDAADPPTVTVIGYSGTTAGTVIFTGTGIMTLGSINAPDSAMATQDIEIEGDGPPTAGV